MLWVLADVGSELNIEWLKFRVNVLGWHGHGMASTPRPLTHGSLAKLFLIAISLKVGKSFFSLPEYQYLQMITHCVQNPATSASYFWMLTAWDNYSYRDLLPNMLNMLKFWVADDNRRCPPLECTLLPELSFPAHVSVCLFSHHSITTPRQGSRSQTVAVLLGWGYY